MDIEIKRGKAAVITATAILIVILILDLIYDYYFDQSVNNAHIIRVFVFCILSFLMYRGIKWAKAIIEYVAALWVLLSIINLIFYFSIFSIINIIAFGASGIILTSQNVSKYLEYIRGKN